MRKSLTTVVLAVLWAAAPAHGATKTYSTGPIAVSLPAGSVVERSLAVPDRGPVSFASVALHIDGSRDSDLTVSLVSPSGTAIVLAQRQGGSGTGYGAGKAGCEYPFAEFEDDGFPLAGAEAPLIDGPYAPEQPLAALDGEEANGSWTLRIENAAGGVPGRLLCGQLTLSRDVLQTERAEAGGVAASLAFHESDFRYAGVRLTIERRGRTILDTPVRRLEPPGARAFRPVVRDLDADGEPEVVLDLFTGGAHCCTLSLLYRYLPDLGRYRQTLAFWGNAGYRLQDLDGDGRPELVSADDRFAYAFTSYAASADPIQLWHFDHGRLLDVTTRFPGRVRADAARLWRGYLSVRDDPSFGDVRGLLAAWAADLYRLGRGGEVWRRLDAVYRRGDLGRSDEQLGYPAGRRYLAELRAFLRRTGYAGG